MDSSFKQKNCLCIHDISCLGKCSLTAALPIISSTGVSVGILPTALLSTQTGGLNEYTYLDLTEEMKGITEHWKKLNVNFDCVFSGFLGSKNQVDIVKNAVDFFGKDSIFICDPAMADNGKLYDTFDEKFVDAMGELCSSADIIVPNVTETLMLLGFDADNKITTNNVDFYLNELYEKFDLKYAIITGIEDIDDKICTAVYNGKDIHLAEDERQKGMFHSCGDLFASSLVGCICNDIDINSSVDISAKFVSNSIKNTIQTNGDSRFGLCFETCLYDLNKKIREYKNE